MKDLSKREISRRYSKLIADLNEQPKTDLTYRFNCYICQLEHVTKTKEVDHGTTPMMIQCDQCSSWAKSTFYDDRFPMMSPTHEWFRPELKKILKLKGEMLEHVLSGGLMIRKIAQPDEKV